MKYTKAITADGDFLIAYVHRRRDAQTWEGTYNVTGSFGGGTLTFKLSTDGGTTKNPMQDASGNTMTLAAAGNFNTKVGSGSKNSDMPQLWITMSGSTSPAVTVDLIDNR